MMGSKDSSEVKRTCCSCRGSGLSAQKSWWMAHNHANSEDLMPSPGLLQHQACLWCTYMHAGRRLMTIK